MDKAKPLTAGDFVKDNACLCFEPHDTVRHIIEKMRKNNTYAVAIMENRNFAGLLTGHDVLVHAAAWKSKHAPSLESVSKAFNSMKAADVMIRNPVTVDARTPIDEALRIMTENGFRYMPVLRKGQPVGILNIISVAQYMTDKLRRDGEEKDTVLSYLMNHENYGGVSQRRDSI